ncbi:MAG: NapC/NirT family cytochrome c [Candidatus Rokubacteria bacterium]|nr:NapC/NirT family cytochrome c [Candidatus Rokubacteria bacterium]
MTFRRALLRGASLLLVLGGTAPAGGDAGADRAFLDRHWRRPVPPQGEAPARWSALEKSLAPQSCGACHQAQLADWKTSVHARSLGPGVAGQLVEMRRSDPESFRLCLSCHGPLAEQQPDIERHGRSVPNPEFDPGLQAAGLACAVCHVRQHERFGPPRRIGMAKVTTPRPSLPHGGVTRTPAFSQSTFCTSCHQFSSDGFALNGKLLENTYEEWKLSAAARVRRQCQDCHMPERRHLWRGIHDPDMVKSGVEILATTAQRSYRPGDELVATIVVRSVGVGHDFPTYVTPRVVVRAALIDNTGAAVGGSGQEYAIAREVTLDLSREISDTRIPPGGSASFTYRRRLERKGLSLSVSVMVYPDHFYTGFFESLLASGAGAGAPQIREALAASRRSAFEIFRKTVRLT